MGEQKEEADNQRWSEPVLGFELFWGRSGMGGPPAGASGASSGGEGVERFAGAGVAGC